MNDQRIESSGLPAQYYTNPAFFDQEMHAHFVNGWPSIGATQMIPNAGDTHPVSIAGRPLLLTRDRDGEVHVFHNVCRHRGTQLVTEPCNRGNGLISCPYHSWTYRLDGKLASAPACDLDDATRATHGLLPVRSAFFFDTIFVNLSGTAQPFDEMIRPLAERWAGYDLSLLRLGMWDTYSAACDWKLVAENFLDVMHAPIVHPQLGVADINNYEHEFRFMNRDISAFISPIMGAELSAYWTYPPFPEGPPGFEKGVMDLISIFPNTAIILTNTLAQTSVLHPQHPGVNGPRSTYELFTYLIGDEAVTQVGEEFRASMQEVAVQDLDVMNRQQVGRVGDASDKLYMVDHWDEPQVMLYKRIAECYSD